MNTNKIQTAAESICPYDDAVKSVDVALVASAIWSQIIITEWRVQIQI